MTIRRELAADAGAIRRVHEAAFRSAQEGRLVDALRAAGRLSVSLVAERAGEVVGHIAFSPVSLAERPGEKGGLGLAPVAVEPGFQRQGIGGRLIRDGLAACKQEGYRFVVVLGAPAYYGRFGFASASRWGLRDEYGGGEAFMVLELQPPGIPEGAGLVRYAPEFAVLEE